MNAIDLEVIYQSTLQIARELTVNMLRTGYSTIIKESQDFTFAIFDGDGRMVAQGIPQPLHIGPLASQVNEIRRRFQGNIRPGDAFIVNHPYQACQNHATDVTVISPVFAGERLASFIGNIAHKPDLGGKVPGTNSGDATDLFQEGLLIPPLKILRGGEINADVEAMIYGQHPHAGGHLGRHPGADQHQHLRPEQVRGAVRQVRRRQGAGLLAALDGHLRDGAAQGDRQGAGRALRAGDRLPRRRRRRPCQAAPHLGLARGQGRPAAFHPRQRRAGARTGQPAALRLAQLHRMPGEDDLHPGAAGERRPVAPGAGVLSAGGLAAQSALSGAGQHVRAAEPGHDLGDHAARWRHALPGRVPAPGSAAGGSLSSAGRHPQHRAAGTRNTRSSTAAPARAPTATASAPWTSSSSTS